MLNVKQGNCYYQLLRSWFSQILPCNLNYCSLLDLRLCSFPFQNRAVFKEGGGSATYQGKTVFCGGIDPNTSQPSKECVLFNGERWRTIPNLEEPRKGAAVAFANGRHLFKHALFPSK